MTLEDATQVLAGAGIDNPRMEARLLFAHALGITRDQTLTAAATPEQAARFAGLVMRRAAREPFAYITGRKEFWSMAFEVGPGVLVPRPDTETLIEEALRLVPDRFAPLVMDGGRIVSSASGISSHQQIWSRPRRFRLKTDFEPRPGRLGVFFKSSRRGHASPAFQTRDDGLRGLHTLRYLLLREACAGAGFDQRGGKRKLFLQCFILASVLRVLHPLLVEIINRRAFH